MDLLLLNINEFIEHHNKTIVIPIGAIENHGPHLPLGTDSIISEFFSKRIASKFKCIVSPTIHYTCKSLQKSGGGCYKPGTNCINNHTFGEKLEKILENYIKDKYENIIILNGHLENAPMIENALENILEKTIQTKPYYHNKQTSTAIISINYWDVLTLQDCEEITHTKIENFQSEHAGIMETSIMLYIDPSLVGEYTQLGCIEKTKPYIHNKKHNLLYSVLSDPKDSTIEIGEKFCKTILQKIYKILSVRYLCIN